MPCARLSNVAMDRNRANDTPGSWQLAWNCCLRERGGFETIAQHAPDVCRKSLPSRLSVLETGSYVTCVRHAIRDITSA
jgi:hypothetical protein